ncbi:serine/threonine-protein kinase [Kitasatospora purpeofusca]|uniref:serine/threonine-protein kinase n=1 Tax=Kitasatospora purpeofusca TaxID=67352 RepID=UPI002255D3FF|nr:serine/threonine-protein kinase [Kitasatospora purpeofusca]MCX4752059.1 serine/threonine protein kinase [Kitasatospora purpeofusca]WSR31662.1 serine/threonine protein kinase [Kitasatospora purpeofusca]
MRPRRESDPAEVGPYRVLAELGRGGMGRVLLGAGPDGRLVAVKQVHERFAADDAFRARFRREVAASRRVSGAYTAAVMDADVEAVTPWLASVFVVGPSLADAVESGGPLPSDAVHGLAVGLATALVEIHRAGLIHRDLKPGNVLLAEDGVRVIDFGIARAVEEDAELTHTGGVIGSPAFMSPEQAEGRALTPASDVFSLASLLALALSGRSPFEGASALRTLYNIVHSEPDLGGVAPETRPFLEACLVKDPAARPTPARLLELLGPVAPAARRWPAAVHTMIAAQQAEVDRLLADPGRTLVLRAVAPEVVVVQPEPTALRTVLDASATGSGDARAAVDPTSAPAPDPPRRRRRPTALVTTVVLALAGFGGGGYLLLHDPNGGGAGTGPAAADKYLKAPICSEAAPQLPLPAEQRRTEYDRYFEQTTNAETQCAWYGSYLAVDGARYWEQTAAATVTWKIRRTSGSDNGTRVQRKDFGDFAKGKRNAPGIGVGDDAFWDEPGRGESCSLAVRDGNVWLWVGLGGPDHPAESCEAQAAEVARTALAAMPH